MDTKALQLCARFALQPNMLGYCGSGSAPAKLVSCIRDGDCADIPEELKQFIVLNPYLQTISEITGKDPFSHEVIESYWLGNDLLLSIKPEHYGILLRNLEKQGVPEFLIKEITDKKPQEFIPIHLFNILHVGVGKANGSVPFNLDSINNCMVRWGKVSSKIKAQKSKLKSQNTKYQTIVPAAERSGILNTTPHLLSIETVKLIQKGNRYEIVDAMDDMPYYSELVGDLEVGDTVALHWGWVAMKLTQSEKRKLQKWTQKLLDSVTAG